MLTRIFRRRAGWRSVLRPNAGMRSNWTPRRVTPCGGDERIAIAIECAEIRIFAIHPAAHRIAEHEVYGR